jgi:hypothetical protein
MRFRAIIPAAFERVSLKPRLIVNAACLAASAGLAAEPPASQPKAHASDGRDPNEIVCQRVQMPGSRLIAGRMCKTRAEWAQQRLTDRMDTERAQTRRSY